jgi:hypothetical protein
MRLNRLLALFVVSFVAACSILESNDGPSVSVTAVIAPLDLALGDTARIAVTIRNTGDRDVSFGTSGCNMDFLISDLDGNAYTPAESVACTLELRAPIVLSPGESHQISTFTTGRVVPQGSQAAPITLPKGTYRLRPIAYVHSGNENAVVVSAEPVFVTFR